MPEIRDFPLDHQVNGMDPVPTPREPVRHSVTIEELDHGYVVQVGCKNFAFTSLKQLLEAVGNYLLDREKIESQFKSGTLQL